MQAVEPLRDVKLFRNQVYEHNRSLLEYNGKLIAELKALRLLARRLREYEEADADWGGVDEALDAWIRDYC
jgi:hypothetical protein